MFFPRLRRHAKWMFVFLAVALGGGFVLFGVGAGGTGVGDILRGGGNRSGIPSVSSAEKETQKRPLDVKATISRMLAPLATDPPWFQGLIDPEKIGMGEAVILHVTIDSHSDEALFEFGKALEERVARERAEIDARLEQERAARAEAEAKAEAERKAREEAERTAREEAQRMIETERKARDEAARAAEAVTRSDTESARRARETPRPCRSAHRRRPACAPFRSTRRAARAGPRAACAGSPRRRRGW